MTSPRLVWSEAAEVAKRRQRPEQYWCVGDETGVQYSREQRRRSAGKNTLRTRARKIVPPNKQAQGRDHRPHE
jgi:hypothetical protein